MQRSSHQFDYLRPRQINRSKWQVDQNFWTQQEQEIDTQFKEIRGRFARESLQNWRRNSPSTQQSIEFSIGMIDQSPLQWFKSDLEIRESAGRNCEEDLTKTRRRWRRRRGATGRRHHSPWPVQERNRSSKLRCGEDDREAIRQGFAATGGCWERRRMGVFK